jgi:hypothetical protein
LAVALNTMSESFCKTLSNAAEKHGFLRQYCAHTHFGTHYDKTGSTNISVKAIDHPYGHDPRLRLYSNERNAPEEVGAHRASEIFP